MYYGTKYYEKINLWASGLVKVILEYIPYSANFDGKILTNSMIMFFVKIFH